MFSWVQSFSYGEGKKRGSKKKAPGSNKGGGGPELTLEGDVSQKKGGRSDGTMILP